LFRFKSTDGGFSSHQFIRGHEYCARFEDIALLEVVIRDRSVPGIILEFHIPSLVVRIRRRQGLRGPFPNDPRLDGPAPLRRRRWLVKIPVEPLLRIDQQRLGFLFFSETRVFVLRITHDPPPPSVYTHGGGRRDLVER